MIKRVVIPLFENPPSHQSNTNLGRKRGKAYVYKNERLAGFQQTIMMLVKSALNKQRAFSTMHEPYAAIVNMHLKNRAHGDVTNMIKSIEDAIFNGMLSENDKLCHFQMNGLFYDKQNPRMEIIWWPLSDGAICPNVEDVVYLMKSYLKRSKYLTPQQYGKPIAKRSPLGVSKIRKK